MGGDGGSIHTRIDMVRTSGYKFARNLGGMGYTPNILVKVGNEKLSKLAERNLRWSTCALSQEPLRPPLVACRLGNLYNKESVINRLLSKSMPNHMMHIKSLKDLKECKVQFNNGHITCPICMIDLEGGLKAYINWNCGCVLSERAFKNVQQQDMCLFCGDRYNTSEDLVLLLNDDEKYIQKVLENKRNEKKIKKKKQTFNQKHLKNIILNPLIQKKLNI